MLPRRLLLLQVGLLALGGCGFQLRGAPQLAFSSLYIGIAESSTLGTELKRNLSSLGQLDVITDAKLQPGAQVILDILSEAREKTVVGVNASGHNHVRQAEKLTEAIAAYLHNDLPPGAAIRKRRPPGLRRRA